MYPEKRVELYYTDHLRPHTADPHLFTAEQQTAAREGILNDDWQTEICSPRSRASCNTVAVPPLVFVIFEFISFSYQILAGSFTDHNR